MHCCLAAGAAAKVREARSASRALSISWLNDRSTAKITETTANDRLLHFMALARLYPVHSTFQARSTRAGVKLHLGEGAGQPDTVPGCCPSGGASLPPPQRRRRSGWPWRSASCRQGRKQDLQRRHRNRRDCRKGRPEVREVHRPRNWGLSFLANRAVRIRPHTLCARLASRGLVVAAPLFVAHGWGVIASIIEMI